MSLACVDEALTEKLKSVYPNVYFGPLFRVLEKDAFDNKKKFSEDLITTEEDTQKSQVIDRDSKNTVANKTSSKQYKQGKNQHIIAFPMIAFDRMNNPFGFQYRANDPAIRRGRFLGKEESLRERAFPVTPLYQIDVISDRRFEVDEIWRELCMYLYLKPNVDVIYSKGTKEEFSESYPIKLMDTDNATDVMKFEEMGVIYRQTISIQVTNVQMIFDKEVNLIEDIPVRYLEMKE